MGGALLGQEAADQWHRFLQHVEAATHRREVVAVRGGFPLVPPGSEPELEAPVTEMIEGRGGLGQLTGIAVADVEDQASDTGSGCLARQRGEGCYRLEMRHRPALRR